MRRASEGQGAPPPAPPAPRLPPAAAANMADTEFEEFRRFFDRLPQHIKAPAHIYTLVHDVYLDDDEEGERDNQAMDSSSVEFKTINNNNSNNNNGQNNNGQNNNNNDQHIIEDLCNIETFSMGIKGQMRKDIEQPSGAMSIDSAIGSMDEGKTDMTIDYPSLYGAEKSLAESEPGPDTEMESSSAITSSSSSSHSATSTTTVMQMDQDAPTAQAPATCSQPMLWRSDLGNSVVVATAVEPPTQRPQLTGTGERRRRKLPEIPKTKKAWNRGCTSGGLSLAEELGEALGGAVGGMSYTTSFKNLTGMGTSQHSSHYDMVMMTGYHSQGSMQGPAYFKSSSSSMYLKDEDSSPESELSRSCFAMGEDSGNSTAHSPDGLRSNSPPGMIFQTQFLGCPSEGIISPRARVGMDSLSPPISPTSSCLSVGSTDAGFSLGMNSDSQRIITGGGVIPQSRLKLLEPTHRGLHKFLPRHHDEIEVEIGDPIYVQKEADDLWCEGINLRTGRKGIFPSAHVVDVEYADFDPSAPKIRRERYLLGYLGSVEALAHKGNRVLRQAVNKIVSNGLNKKGEQSGEAAYQRRPQSCILEVSDQGIRMVDKSKPRPHQKPCHDYFYSLKHVSYCGYLPSDPRYLGFITKHPRLYRFACHVFLADQSTRPVAEAVGRAFQRFYQKFIETAYPIEDIYLE
ncbi:JNK-interacting protein 1 isoform X2 [Ischnura elegans]|uniref:JNK-interacting protein 1 isoform X2 n=1 Tax=Ischnura elegans TaxID=197161 RepID=UPI001ED883B4|nr:JNK-interacting protein 1 isoform X2 [Ischnura elegans]